MKRGKYTILVLVITVSIIVFLLLNLLLGSVAIPFASVWNILTGGEGDPVAWQNIILKSRLPQALTALVAGAGLSISGLQMQTIFRNPLAGPSVLGISSGASLGVAFVVLLSGQLGGVALSRLGFIGEVALSIAAVVGALSVMGLIVLASRKVAGSVTLLIIGVMIGYLCSAVTEFVVTFASDANIVNLHNWSMGSFSGMTWGNVAAAALVVLPCLAAAFLLAKPMAAYQMGEQYAQSVGVAVRPFCVALVLLSSLLAACVTAFAGPISFVGIAVPHLVKQALGSAKPLHVLPGCVLGGAAFCLLCDLIARSLFAPTELSISSVTAVFGAPVVIWMLVRRQSGEGRA